MNDTTQAQIAGANDLLQLTRTIVSAYVRNNPLPCAELPGTIRNVYASLTGLSTGVVVEAAVLKPAVPIKKSVTAEYLVCLEDGRKLKILRRYLRSRFNLTPEQYRAKWGLPGDYPMTAPGYAAERSKLAKKAGLGHVRPKAKRRKRP